MSDSPISQLPDASAHGPRNAGHPWHAARAANTPGHGLHDPSDPVTEWLLEQPHIDATDFAVLYAIHSLNGRQCGCAWIRRTELCRSSGLSQVALTRALNDLRQRGLVGMSRHAVDSSRSRYLLFVANA